jgi:hypothetical protein
VALVRVEDGQPWTDGTLIGTGTIEPGQPYPTIKDLVKFTTWARHVAPSRVSGTGLIDYLWLRRVREAFRHAPDWECEEGPRAGRRVPFAGLALREEPPRIRITPADGGPVWESPVDVETQA